jgi:hypothetical protein
MTGPLGDVGLGLIGHRLVTMGWDCRSMATKGENDKKLPYLY